MLQEMKKMIDTDAIVIDTLDTPKKSTLRLAMPQILAVMVKNLLMLSYGTTLGFPAILIPGLTGQDSSESIIASKEDISWISSLNKLVVPVSSVLSGVITEPIGRKRSMQCITIPFVSSWLLLYFSTNMWQVYFSLALFGMCGGLIEAPVQTYVAEVTQPEYRGMLSTISSSATVLGVLVQFILGSFFTWRDSALISISFPIASFICLMFVPESPYWLVTHKKEKLGRKSLAWLRGWSTVNETQNEFRQVLQHCKNCELKLDAEKARDKGGCLSFLQRRLRKLKRFGQKDFVWPFSIVVTAFFVNHFTGATTLFNYTVLIFRNLKVPISEYYATIILGVASFLGCVLSVVIIHYTGKRILMFISLTGLIISTSVVAIYAYVMGITEFLVQAAQYAPTKDNYGIIVLVFVILINLTSYIGLKNLPWMLLVELYPEDIRGSACGLSSAIGYLFGFLANKTFLQMMATFTFPGVYLFHGVLGLIALVLFYFIIPETEGRSLDEISNHFTGVSKLNNKFIKKKKKENALI